MREEVEKSKYDLYKNVNIHILFIFYCTIYYYRLNKITNEVFYYVLIYILI